MPLNIPSLPTSPPEVYSGLVIFILSGPIRSRDRRGTQSAWLHLTGQAQFAAENNWPHSKCILSKNALIINIKTKFLEIKRLLNDPFVSIRIITFSKTKIFFQTVHSRHAWTSGDFQFRPRIWSSAKKIGFIGFWGGFWACRRPCPRPIITRACPTPVEFGPATRNAAKMPPAKIFKSTFEFGN